MPEVRVKLPSLLAGVVGRASLTLEAATMQDALDQLVRRYPALRVHLFDETGQLRRHVLCFHNDTRWSAEPLRAGDTITIMQAVTGG
jgi:molybdopterin converting factor small subunit